MFYTILLVSVAHGQIIISREPQAASPWLQSVEAACGTSTLRILGFGASRPEDVVPRLLVNNEPVTGGRVDQLVADLANRRAVYRLSILCGATGRISIRISEGEAQRDGSVRYRSASATINGSQLEVYSGMEDADPSAFWFR